MLTATSLSLNVRSSTVTTSRNRLVGDAYNFLEVECHSRHADGERKLAQLDLAGLYGFVRLEVFVRIHAEPDIVEEVLRGAERPDWARLLLLPVCLGLRRHHISSTCT